MPYFDFFAGIWFSEVLGQFCYAGGFNPRMTIYWASLEPIFRLKEMIKLVGNGFRVRLQLLLSNLFSAYKVSSHRLMSAMLRGVVPFFRFRFRTLVFHCAIS